MGRLKIVYPICCGMDVHRDFVIACIASTNAQGVTQYQSRRFSTYTGGLRECATWLEENNCRDVCMESTGKYWIPVHNILEKTCHVVVTHPKFVKAIKGKKTDKKDAMWIADLFKHDVVSGSFIPPERIRQLRDLCRYLMKLTWNATSEKNRAHNCLTVSNLKLDSVFSNVFGKSASAIIDFMLEHPGEQFDVAPFVHSRCKSPIEDIQAAVDGSFSPWQAEKLKIIQEHMKDIDHCRKLLEDLIFRLAEPYNRQIDLIMTVPGIRDRMTAIRIISEIGVDMNQFESSKHLCSWAGLTPQNNESAGKKKTTRIGKAGQYLKPLLIECSIGAANQYLKPLLIECSIGAANQYLKPLLIECSIGAANPRSQKHPEVSAKYRQLQKRRGAKKARVAIARRLLTAIYHMLLKDEPYQPFVAPVQNSIPKQRRMTAEDAIAMLRRKGYILVDAKGTIIEDYHFASPV